MCYRQYFVISGKQMLPVYFMEMVEGINDDWAGCSRHSDDPI